MAAVAWLVCWDLARCVGFAAPGAASRQRCLPPGRVGVCDFVAQSLYAAQRTMIYRLNSQRPGLYNGVTTALRLDSRLDCYCSRWDGNPTQDGMVLIACWNWHHLSYAEQPTTRPAGDDSRPP